MFNVFWMGLFYRIVSELKKEPSKRILCFDEKKNLFFVAALLL